MNIKEKNIKKKCVTVLWKRAYNKKVKKKNKKINKKKKFKLKIKKKKNILT